MAAEGLYTIEEETPEQISRLLEEEITEQNEKITENILEGYVFMVESITFKNVKSRIIARLNQLDAQVKTKQITEAQRNVLFKKFVDAILSVLNSSIIRNQDRGNISLEYGGKDYSNFLNFPPIPGIDKFDFSGFITPLKRKLGIFINNSKHTDEQRLEFAEATQRQVIEFIGFILELFKGNLVDITGGKTKKRKKTKQKRKNKRTKRRK